MDSSQRKISPKPPVLSPKPNPSEIVKRLSFKRDGQEAAAVRHAAAAETGKNISADGGKHSSKHDAAASDRSDKKLSDDNEVINKQEDRLVTNGTRRDSEKISGSGTESRVSSMIAKLSNGGAKPEEITSSIKSDRQNFMSKFIKNDNESKPEVRDETPAKLVTNNIKENEKLLPALNNNVKNKHENNISSKDVGEHLPNGCHNSSKSSNVFSSDHLG